MNMKARSFIVSALLFALVLVPSALRASANHFGAPSCGAAKPPLRASHAGEETGGARDQFVASMPGRHAPAPRLHRIRGKRISIRRGLLLTPGGCTPMHFVLSDAHVGQQELGGPNPSRGPPSPFSL